MDMKFKKFLLFTMRMNDANQLKIKTSYTKIVNLQLFASVTVSEYLLIGSRARHRSCRLKRRRVFQVMSTTYNIVSVMLNQALKSRKTEGSV